MQKSLESLKAKTSAGKAEGDVEPMGAELGSNRISADLPHELEHQPSRMKAAAATADESTVRQNREFPRSRNAEVDLENPGYIPRGTGNISQGRGLSTLEHSNAGLGSAAHNQYHSVNQESPSQMLSRNGGGNSQQHDSSIQRQTLPEQNIPRNSNSKTVQFESKQSQKQQKQLNKENSNEDNHSDDNKNNKSHNSGDKEKEELDNARIEA